MGGRGIDSSGGFLSVLRRIKSEDTQTYENPATGIEHQAYTATIEDIPLYFDRVNHAAASATKALKNSGKLPATLSQHIDGVFLVDEAHPTNKDVLAQINEGIITVFGNRSINEGTLAHEAAHPFAQHKWGSTTPPDNSDYMAAINSLEPKISAYSYRSPGEDFAEAVRMFIENPKQLKKRSPLRFDIIDNLMKDPDYGG